MQNSANRETTAQIQDAAEQYLTPEELDAILSCLSDRRRRLVVGYVADAQEPVTVDEIVHSLLDEETIEDGARESGTDEHEVRVALHHSHLPKLSAAGVVTRDEEGNTLRAGERLGAATAVLDGDL